MSENNETCQSVFPKAQAVVFKSFVFSTTQRYSVYCHRGLKKPENIHCFFEKHRVRQTVILYCSLSCETVKHKTI